MGNILPKVSFECGKPHFSIVPCSILVAAFGSEGYMQLPTSANECEFIKTVRITHLARKIEELDM